MRKKRILTALVLILSIFCFLSSTVNAAEQVGITNKIELGFINVRVEDASKAREATMVLPGDKVENTKIIHNVGSPCYVRASISFNDMTYMDENNLYGMPTSWERKDDGYYYYKDVLNTGDKVELFKGIIVPDNLPQGTYEDKVFSLKISVDAIQSKNFEPQYEETKPWGEVEVIESVVSEDADINSLKKPDTQTLEIIYPEDMSGLIANQDDFFKNFPYMMPGDTYSDTLKIKNESKEAIDLYFKTETDKNPDSLKDISLKITSNIKGVEETVYEGDLAATELGKGVNLGTVKSEEEKKIAFEVGVPATVTNEFSVESSGVEWHFSTSFTEEEKEPAEDANKPSEGSGNSNNDSKDDSAKEPSKEPVKKEEVKQEAPVLTLSPRTGDETPLLCSILLMIASVIGMIWAIKSLKSTNKGDC